MSAYLVTGGAGFIGSHLVTALLARGDTVRVLDDLSTGKLENLGHVAESVDFVEGSIADAACCTRVVAGMDFVLHQAALPSVPRSVADPVTSNRINTDGTLNMLVAARDAGVKRFVFASSSSVYGDLPGLPKDEDMPTSPQSPYAITKLTGEHYCRAFYHLYGLETVCLRYFNVFGPRQDPNSPYAAVIPIFLGMMARGEGPTILGDGEQSRDFTHVDNVVHANLLACEAPAAAAGKAFNCATGQPVTVNHMARALAEVTGIDLPPRYLPERPGDIRHSHADYAKARRLLGFEPRKGFEEGLRETVAWFQREMRK